MDIQHSTYNASKPPSSLSGAQSKVERLFSLTEKRLSNVLYRYLWNRQDVQDTIQEAFMKLWSKRSTVDWERAESLIFRIAINLACTKIRKRKRWTMIPFMTQSATEVTPETLLSDSQKDVALRHAIDALPEKLKSVMLLTLFSEMNYNDIGLTLKIPTGTVASRRNQAIARMKQSVSSRSSHD